MIIFGQGHALIGRIIPAAQSDDWRTWGDNEIADFVNNARVQGIVRIFGPGFCEELPSLVERQTGSNLIPNRSAGQVV